jgi:hypothetical protein
VVVGFEFGRNPIWRSQAQRRHKPDLRVRDSSSGLIAHADDFRRGRRLLGQKHKGGKQRGKDQADIHISLAHSGRIARTRAAVSSPRRTSYQKLKRPPIVGAQLLL